jgi:hypothetical protein
MAKAGEGATGGCRRLEMGSFGCKQLLVHQGFERQIGFVWHFLLRAAGVGSWVRFVFFLCRLPEQPAV